VLKDEDSWGCGWWSSKGLIRRIVSKEVMMTCRKNEGRNRQSGEKMTCQSSVEHVISCSGNRSEQRPRGTARCCLGHVVVVGQGSKAIEELSAIQLGKMLGVRRR
jgi:hypothetical protein